MTLEDHSIEVATLCRVSHLFGERGWCRATGGNFSLRIDAANCLITQSGKDKSVLTGADLMLCSFDCESKSLHEIPSAETPLHTRLYQLDESIGAVFHTHSVNATLLSKHAGAALSCSGFEMQKALATMTSHEDSLSVPIFDNDQNMPRLADAVAAAWRSRELSSPGFLVRGHGLYAWGKNAEQAQRHVEGFEFLFDCLWQEKLAGY